MRDPYKPDRLFGAADYFIVVFVTVLMTAGLVFTAHSCRG